MKVQFRSILFALVLPVAACGGDRETPTVSTMSPYDFLPKPIAVNDAPSLETPITQPAVVDTKPAMPTKYDELVAAGKELTAKGQFGDAKEMFEAAIKLDKKKAEPHIEMARMYIAMNERGLAITSANKAIKLAPNSSQAWNTKGRAELNAKNYENAITAFTNAVELNKDNTFAWNNLGYTELLLKRYEDAAEHLKEATEKKDATGFMFNNLGTALEHLDKVDEARLAYEAGGKLGSKEASSSRSRLEGVKSVAIAKGDDEVKGTVHDEVRDEAPKAKEYDLTDEGDETDDVKTADEVKPDDASTDEADDKVEGTTPAEAKVDEKSDDTTAATPVETGSDVAPPSDNATH